MSVQKETFTKFIENIPVIGIVGAPASGKESTARIIREHYGFESLGVSEGLADYAYALGLEPPFERDTLRNTYLRLVPVLGENFLAQYAIDSLRIISRRKKIKGSVIEGFRIRSDIPYLKRKLPNFKVIGIQANEEVRFERIQKRRRIADVLTRVEFQRIEQKEGSWIEETMKMADIIIVNEGSEEELSHNIRMYVEKNFRIK